MTDGNALLNKAKAAKNDDKCLYKRLFVRARRR